MSLWRVGLGARHTVYDKDGEVVTVCIFADDAATIVHEHNARAEPSKIVRGGQSLHVNAGTMRVLLDQHDDLLAALNRIVDCDLSTVRSDYNRNLLDAIADAHDLLVRLQS